MNGVHAFSIVRSEREFTPAERARIAEDPGKGRRALTGSYIDDLAATGKAIWLCGAVGMNARGFEVSVGSCAAKFNFASYGYAVKRNLPIVRGKCDGCGEHHDSNVMFVPASRQKTL